MLKEAGAEVPSGSGWQKMLCPFHDDTHPSAAVNHKVNGFICHSCGVSGDAVKLIRDHWGLSYSEALAFASDINATTNEENTPQRKRRRLFG